MTSQSLAGNQHADDARFALSLLPTGTSAKHDADVALIQATLALAYEQRTANLIALMGWLAQQGAVSKPIAEQVDERLGLSRPSWMSC